MLTMLLVFVVFVAVLALIGGVAMCFNNKGCFLTWWVGYNAIQSGCEILAHVVPAIVEAIAEAGR